MNCPKCQHRMEFRERVCRRCLYCAELDSYFSVEVPRSRRRGASRIGVLRNLRMRVLEQSTWARQQHELAPWLLLLVSVVPGVGHILSGRKIEGILTFAVVTGLVSYCLFSDILSSTAMPLLGIAYGLHIMSLLRMTMKMDFSLPRRLALSLLFFLLLGVGIYTPLTDLMLTYKPEYVFEARYNGIPEFGNSVFVFSLPYIMSAVIVAWLLGKFLSLVFSLPERKRT